MDSEHPHLDLYPGLAEWWRGAEQIWTSHRSSERLSLRQQVDFRRKLTGQLPTPPLRVVYGASGMHVVAALVDDPRSVCEHKLYWGTVATTAEGYYLCAILNSPALTEAVRPLMSYGKDERDVDKHLWKLPIPEYDEQNPGHRRIAELGRTCAEHIGSLDLEEGGNFVALRRRVRAALTSIPAAGEINELTAIMLED